MHRPIPLIYALTEVQDALEERAMPVYVASGLSRAQFSLMYILYEEGGMRQSALAEHRRCVKSNITYLVAAMERDGILKRARDPEDGRVKVVQLTDEGRRRFLEVVDALSALEAQLHEDLGAPLLSRFEQTCLLLAQTIDETPE